MVSAKVEEGILRIHGLLEKARISPSSVALCLATGGMVNMPLIKSRLREIFGPQRLHVSERGNTVISEGAAWIAHDKANLSLAKNVEILVARNTYFPVIKAGAFMPREGDVHAAETLSLYCTDPRDGIAQFQIAAPKKPGRQIQATDERDILNCLSIEVDPQARPFLESLTLDASVDENLILHASAKSLGWKNSSDSIEIHILEFGLRLPTLDAPDDGFDDLLEGSIHSPLPKGSIRLRSNVSSRKLDSLVPGELLYQYNPSYFDRRLDPPENQDLERLYYTPCAICKRPSNHPQCRCASASA